MTSVIPTSPNGDSADRDKTAKSQKLLGLGRARRLTDSHRKHLMNLASSGRQKFKNWSCLGIICKREESGSTIC